MKFKNSFKLIEHLLSRGLPIAGIRYHAGCDFDKSPSEVDEIIKTIKEAKPLTKGFLYEKKEELNKKGIWKTNKTVKKVINIFLNSEKAQQKFSNSNILELGYKNYQSFAASVGAYLHKNDLEKKIIVCRRSTSKNKASGNVYLLLLSKSDEWNVPKKKHGRKLVKKIKQTPTTKFIEKTTEIQKKEVIPEQIQRLTRGLLFEVETIVRNIGAGGSSKYIVIPKVVRERNPLMFETGKRLVVSAMTNESITFSSR